MQFIIALSDKSAKHMVMLTMREFDLKRPAVDIVVDVIGATDTQELVDSNILSAGQVDDLRALQSIIFDHDAEGQFIRDGIMFSTNGKELDPDRPMIEAFVQSERDGIKYMRCDLSVSSEDATLSIPVLAAGATAIAGATQPPGNAGSGGNANSTIDDQIAGYARIMFLHQISVGFLIDVINDFPELMDSIAEAEKKGWIEVDVQKTAYRLTAEGTRAHASYIAEAQDLIKRFDIYGDVDIDSSSVVRFDTGLGQDMRVPILEMSGVDPFRARFLIGINDGEWDQLSNWFELYKSAEWYQGIFSAIEQAPDADQIGRNVLLKVIDEGKSQLRQDSQFQN